MPKIYNEIVIDMNPESPTFEETLYEDSFEYNGDMILAQGDVPEGHQIAVLDDDKHGWKVYEMTSGEWLYTGATTTQSVHLGDLYPSQTYNSIEEANQKLSGEYAKPVEEREDIGLPPMTQETWMGMSIEDQAKYILKMKYNIADPDADTSVDIHLTPDNKDDDVTILSLIEKLKLQPLKGELDPTEIGFLEEKYGGTKLSYDPITGQYIDIGELEEFGPGTDGIYGTEDDPGGIAGRKAGVTYGAAGLTLEGAEEAYDLGVGGAERQLGTMLGGLQTGAESLTGTDYTGLGRRAKTGAMAKIKKGFETGMGGYEDLITGLEGTIGRARDVYDLASETYDIAGTQADLDYRQGIYGLETTAETSWMTDWGTFWESLPEA